MRFPHGGPAVDRPLRVRLHGGMAKSQWRFEPVIWGAPETDEDKERRDDRGGIGFSVFDEETGEEVAGLTLDWLAEPDSLGATVSFALTHFANGKFEMPAWIASGRLIARPGGAVISQLALTPDAVGFPEGLEKPEDYEMDGAIPPEWVPSGGITSGLLRKIPLGMVFAGLQALRETTDSAKMREFLQHIATTYPDFRKAIAESNDLPSNQTSAGPKKGGRPGLPDEHLRQVALAYLDMSGQRGVHALLSERFNKSPEAIKDLIRAARKAGWLAPGQAGRRGAYPGPRLLQEQDSARALDSEDRSPED